VAGRNPLEVHVSLDGQRVQTVTLADDEWQTLELPIPPDPTRRFRRIDLAVSGASGVIAQVRVAAADIVKDDAVQQRRPR
jgi:hypothetical protein